MKDFPAALVDKAFEGKSEAHRPEGPEELGGQAAARRHGVLTAAEPRDDGSFIQSNTWYSAPRGGDASRCRNRAATFSFHPVTELRRLPSAHQPYSGSSRATASRYDLGVMGALPPQGHAQVMVRIADYGQSPQAACDGPRFRFVQNMDVSVEEGRFPAGTLEELQRRGHRIVNVDDYNQFGSAQLIWKLDGGYFAASDPRRDGQAVGF